MGVRTCLVVCFALLMICEPTSGVSASRFTPQWKAKGSPALSKTMNQKNSDQEIQKQAEQRRTRRRRPRLPQRLYKLRPQFFQGLLDLQEEAPPVSSDDDLTVLPEASPKQQAEQEHRSLMIYRAFQIADLNGNGSLDLYETYILTLRAYLWINRQAPIPPPTLAMVTKLFDLCDVNHNQSVELPEFVALVNLLTERALWRMTAFRVLQWILAPLCAEYLIHKLPSPRSLLQQHLPIKIPPALLTRPVARTIALALTMAVFSKLLWRLVECALEQRLAWKQRQQHEQKQEPPSTQQK